MCLRIASYKDIYIYVSILVRIVDAHVGPIIESIRADRSSNNRALYHGGRWPNNRGAVRDRKIVHCTWWRIAEARRDPSKGYKGTRRHDIHARLL